MLRHFYLCFLFFFAIALSAEANAYRYRVYLDGKPDSKPVALSERAQQRRSQLAIETDEMDYSVSESYLQQLREAGLVILARSRWLNTAVVMRSDSLDVLDETWSRLPFVTKVETLTKPDVKPQLIAIPEQKGDIRTRSTVMIENNTSPLREVNAYESLYAAGHRGRGMLIALFDGGFTRLNECDFLFDKVDFVYDMYVPDAQDSIFACDTHGFQCMSVMACLETEGVCGTAQDARYCLFRTENSNFECAIEEDMWVVAAEMADSLGVDIISSSLGYNEFDGNLLTHSRSELAQNTAIVSQGAKIASQKGMLICNSAGNEGAKEWEMLLFPADTEEVLAIGAYSPELVAAKFTSKGFLEPYVKPDVAARGQNCYTLVPTNQGFEVRTNASGTSFSTPLVAGLCASLWSAVPEMTPAELRQVVCESASDSSSPTILTGYGLPDFAIALQKARELHSTAIEQITTEAAASETTASARYYNMMGQPLSAPPAKGMYIDRGRVVTR